MAPWSEESKKGSSGLVDEGIITITSSRMLTPEKFDGPVWEISGEIEDENGNKSDGKIDYLSLGAFEPGDVEGSFAVHDTEPDNPKKVFSNRCKGMKWIKSGIEFPEVLAYLESRSRTINGVDLEARDLKAWEGLRLGFKVNEYTYKKDDGSPGKGRQPVVTGFYGTVDAPVAAAASAAPAAASSNGAMTEEKATEIAKGAGSYIAYLEAFQAAGGDVNGPLATKAYFESVKA